MADSIEPKAVAKENKIRIKTVIVIAVVLLLIGIIGLWFFLPKLANHFYFALPIGEPEGLPFVVHANGRDYLNPSVCAGVYWCHNLKPECHNREYFDQYNEWPLKQVGEVTTLFGPSHPVMIPGNGSHTFAVYVPYGNNGCYLLYGLLGGP